MFSLACRVFAGALTCIALPTFASSNVTVTSPPIGEILRLYEAGLFVAVMLVLAAVPLIVLGYEICSKGRVR